MARVAPSKEPISRVANGVEIACGVLHGNGICRGMKTNLTIRIDPDIQARLAELAVDEDRSLLNWSGGRCGRTMALSGGSGGSIVPVRNSMVELHRIDLRPELRQRARDQKPGNSCNQ
jgi:hypothetical protein